MRIRPRQEDGHSSGDERILTEEVLDRSLCGDTEAERALFSELRTFLLRELRSHRLQRAALRHCSADDVVSEVWLRCYTSGSLRTFRTSGQGSLRRFLCRILNRTLVDVLRRHRAAKRGGSAASGANRSVAPEQLEQEIASPEPTPSSDARATELWQLCETVLNQRELTIFRLTEAEGLDSVEIADRLESTPSAVRSCLNRARTKLIPALEERENGEGS